MEVFNGLFSFVFKRLHSYTAVTIEQHTGFKPWYARSDHTGSQNVRVDRKTVIEYF